MLLQFNLAEIIWLKKMVRDVVYFGFHGGRFNNNSPKKQVRSDQKPWLVAKGLRDLTNYPVLQGL